MRPVTSTHGETVPVPIYGTGMTRRKNPWTKFKQPTDTACVVDSYINLEPDNLLLKSNLMLKKHHKIHISVYRYCTQSQKLFKNFRHN
jgi:hypothetical protein